MASKVISHGRKIYHDVRGSLTYKIDVDINPRGVFYSIRREDIPYKEDDHTIYTDLVEVRLLAIEQMRQALGG